MLPTTLLLTTLFATAFTHCTRPLLASAVSAYLTAQLTGSLSPFTAYISNTTFLGYYENAINLPLSSSLIANPLLLTHNRTIYDLSSCATFTELVVAGPTNPFVIGTQLRFTNHKISKFWTSREAWDPIPISERDNADTIRKATDAYLDVFSNPNVTVPWGTPCVRLEGGLYGDPGVNGTCAGGVPTGVPMKRRRYVVDEEMGAVDVLLDFGKNLAKVPLENWSLTECPASDDTLYVGKRSFA
ncbi:hypothetical protein BU23DRAFT_567716 [Bimuria novae-zelandiae CBS 107.79]|uniref:DUF8021 domain-containing protein n=1 Tax=Bimuria novae-zelandiae CBS 107.79 TaxID=1447943 RepID=A0A6A5VBL6_9PLEO|nr:hypothetical protein BU23DRAFT_567716 [Bimuria novae-zelandiae CBS 107.79]